MVPGPDGGITGGMSILGGPTAGFTGEMTCVSEHRQICREEQTLATLSNAALEPRTHSWPFKFKVPAGAPPTQKVGCWLICVGLDYFSKLEIGPAHQSLANSACGQMVIIEKFKPNGII